MTFARFACALVVVGLVSAPSLAQYPTDPAAAGGVTVFGTGEIRTKPHIVEIDLHAGASAELTADAIVKYRDAKKRTLKSFDDLKLEGLTITEQGLSLTPGNSDAMQAMMRGWGPVGNAVNSKMQVQISSTLKVRLAGIQEKPAEEVMETIGKLLDAAQDSGSSIGPSQEELNMAYRYGNAVTSTMVRFVIRDLNSLREQAYEKAVADARARAERLARLNNIKLGDVSFVQEVQVSGDDGNSSAQYYNPYYGYRGASESTDEPHIESSTFEDIPFRVKLLVRFSIEQSSDATAQK